MPANLLLRIFSALAGAIGGAVVGAVFLGLAWVLNAALGIPPIETLRGFEWPAPFIVAVMMIAVVVAGSQAPNGAAILSGFFLLYLWIFGWRPLGSLLAPIVTFGSTDRSSFAGPLRGFALLALLSLLAGSLSYLAGAPAGSGPRVLGELIVGGIVGLLLGSRWLAVHRSWMSFLGALLLPVAAALSPGIPPGPGWTVAISVAPTVDGAVALTVLVVAAALGATYGLFLPPKQPETAGSYAAARPVTVARPSVTPAVNVARMSDADRLRRLRELARDD